MNEIVFNASLASEYRAINYVNRMLGPKLLRRLSEGPGPTGPTVPEDHNPKAAGANPAPEDKTL